VYSRFVLGANAPETALHSPNSFRRPIITLFPSTALIKNFRSASIGWVPTLYLGKPSKGFYRAICAIGFAATPSSPGVVKIARDEMVEITSVSSETWNYKKLDGSGVTGLVSPTCLVKVELDTEPPAYPPLNLEALANFQDPPRRDIIAMKLRALQKERKHDLEGLEMAGMH